MPRSAPTDFAPLTAPIPLQPLAQRVLAERYTQPGERDARAVRRRVARALARVEHPSERARWEARFYEAQVAGFIPGGRINACAGLTGAGTLINCFVQPSLIREAGGSGSIEQAIALARTTLQAGGGVGYGFSDFLAAEATPERPGPVEALRRFNQACHEDDQHRVRRCAQMGVLRCNHPDILAFIHAKDAGGLENFNLSVALTDDFMNALARDEAIALTPPRGVSAPQHKLPARLIWRHLLEAALDHGDPGVLFIDTINRANPLRWLETLTATNPCGEQPLPEFGACCLGAINLALLIHAPFTEQARFDFRRFAQVIDVAVRMLDNVLDCTDWPLPMQREQALLTRRIGLGVTGLADALIMLGLRYDSAGGRAMAHAIARQMRDRAVLSSIRLGREKGAFPAFEAAGYLAPPGFPSRLPRALRGAIERHGLRNSHCLAIAPTGTISLAMGNNVSGGIEPIFAPRYQRRKRDSTGAVGTFEVFDYAALLYQMHHGQQVPLPEIFCPAHALSPMAHVEMVAAVAPFIDGGISKTINLPAHTGVDELGEVLRAAWTLGLKGLTVFRESPGHAGILAAEPH